MLFVHPNTVRYRLRQAADLTGLTPTQPRDAFTLEIALALGRLTDPAGADQSLFCRNPTKNRPRRFRAR